MIFKECDLLEVSDRNLLEFRASENVYELPLCAHLEMIKFKFAENLSSVVVFEFIKDEKIVDKEWWDFKEDFASKYPKKFPKSEFI